MVTSPKRLRATRRRLRRKGSRACVRQRPRVVVAGRLRVLGRCLRRPAPVLLPGGPVHRPAFETRACSPNVRRGAGCAVSGQRRAPDQLMQRSVLRALLLPCRERLRADRAKQRPALGIDHGHDDLRAAGQIEHNPVQDRADTGYGHQVACGDRLHTTSLSGRDRTNGDRSSASSSRAPATGARQRAKTSPILLRPHQLTTTAVSHTAATSAAMLPTASSDRTPSSGSKEGQRTERPQTCIGETLARPELPPTQDLRGRDARAIPSGSRRSDRTA